MARTKYLAVGMAALVLVATAAAPAAFAQRGSDNTTTEVAETTSTTNSSDPTETEIETADAKEQAAKVESKRTEIRARLDALKENRETKLDEKRLATCETKSAKINSIIQKRSAQATTQLAVFKKIANRVEKFISDKKLTIENYDTLAANINDKEAAATAAIEANTNTVFDCASADGSAPGKVAKASVQTVRDALKEYRTAIKDLIVKVKSNSALKTTDSTTSTESDTTTENTTTTGGNQ